MMRQFAREQKIRLFEAGQGICHQLMVESHLVHPGDIFIGADSHTCSYGALGALAVGVGSTDLAAVLLTGKTWLKVPATIKIELNGQLPVGTHSKDLILHIIGQLGIAGATYCSMEICGEAISGLSLSSRLVMANMMIEAGAKTGFVHPEGLQLPYPFTPILADIDAKYQQTIAIDVSGLQPMVSQPHSPDKVVPVGLELGRKVDYAFIGSCVNGRLEDLHIAAKILKNATIHPETRLVIGPASRQVFIEAVQDGTVETLLKAGATFIPPGCGPCVGTHNGIPGGAEVVISTVNRNFKGRMGNPEALIFLASPATVAASARQGQITHPLQYFQD
jgi:3-isopropylmalate/(R)-2-methylmalate dehydratase large subunit